MDRALPRLSAQLPNWSLERADQVVLAHLLEELLAGWPTPLDEIVLIGHSMGGLVARSACHVAEKEKLHWRGKLQSIVFLGTPHHGSPLERAGNWVDIILGIHRYSAPLARLGKIRSAGVTDLRYGNVLEEDWQGRDRFEMTGDQRIPLPLPTGVACYALAASSSRAGTETKKMKSDGLVPVKSALGKHARAEQTLAFPETHTWTCMATGHMDLLSDPEVYRKMLSWLSGD